MSEESANTAQGNTATAEGEGTTQADATAAEGNETSLIAGAESEGQEGSEGNTDGEGEGNTDGEGETSEGDDGESQDGAPESYEDFTLPEGVQVIPEVMDSFKEMAKEDGLSQEQAQRYIDLQTKTVLDQIEAADKLTEGWIEETKNDPDIGGDKLDANMAYVAKAREAFGTPELNNLLNDTRLGNKVEVVKFFAKVGKAMSEDTFVKGEGSQATPKSAADTMYNGK